MGCGDACPVYPGKRYLDWELTDPAGKTVEDVRPIIDHIDERVRQLLAELLGEARPLAVRCLPDSIGHDLHDLQREGRVLVNQEREVRWSTRTTR